MKWHGRHEMPKPFRPFVWVHGDGSGAKVAMFRKDGMMIDEDGKLDDDDSAFDLWAYLPPGFPFHGETALLIEEQRQKSA